MQILSKLILPDKSLTHFFDRYRFWPPSSARHYATGNPLSESFQVLKLSLAVAKNQVRQ